ncbi:MAG TPA: helix-turn-helix transcriptional regulator [Dehalococcoidia bacterium]|nr:helix-turn-helix transcriptional regulator [Dehalococcoidia bacterium]
MTDTQPPVSDWSQMLRQVRKSLRLSRASLAERAGVSAETVKAYELGLRHPSRSLLTAILDATKIDRGRRDAIIIAAGYASDVDRMGPERWPGYYFTVEEAQAHSEELPWPSFILSEFLEVVAANSTAEKLWGRRVADLPDQTDRSFIRFASDPYFVERLVNMDDMLRVGVAIFKGHYRGGETLEQPSSYFGRILEDFLQGDPTLVARLAQLWIETPNATAKQRWAYPVVWDEPGVGRMTFLAMVNPCNESLGHAFNDWIPTDAQSWANIEALRARQAPPAS